MTEIAVLVSNLRKKYKICSVPIDVVKICKRCRLVIEKCDLSDIERSVGYQISSMIEYDRKKRKGFIRVNVNDSETAQRLAIAHELGHFYLHIQNDNSFLCSFNCIGSYTETEANEFATELLVPKDQLRKEYDEAFFPTSTFLARVFEVPVQTMQGRLAEMRLEYFG